MLQLAAAHGHERAVLQRRLGGQLHAHRRRRRRRSRRPAPTPPASAARRWRSAAMGRVWPSTAGRRLAASSATRPTSPPAAAPPARRARGCRSTSRSTAGPAAAPARSTAAVLSGRRGPDLTLGGQLAPRRCGSSPTSRWRPIPATGMLVGETQTFPDGVYYDTYRIGGTSLASPLMAGEIARADQTAGSRSGSSTRRSTRWRSNPSAIYDVAPPARSTSHGPISPTRWTRPTACSTRRGSSTTRGPSSTAATSDAEHLLDDPAHAARDHVATTT